MTKKDKVQKGEEGSDSVGPDVVMEREEEPTLSEQVIQEEEQLKGDLMRLTADIENLKNDVLAQSADSGRRATEFAVRALSPAMDALDMALKTMREDAQDGVLADWRNGIEKVQDRFNQSFIELGVVPVPTDGGYDPKFHEAVEQIPGEKYAILEVVGIGWMWRDEDAIIVPAKVHVGSGE